MKKLIITILAAGMMLSGCKKFSELQTDPNRSTQATPDLLLTAAEVNAFNRVNVGAALATRQLIFTDGASAEQYYTWQRAGYDAYDQLRNIKRIETEALRLDKREYLPVVKFLQAYYFFELTQTFGDVPFKQALQGDTGEGRPAYDAQEEVLTGILELLEQANSEITASTAAVQGDVVYGGNMQKWKKLINTYTIRVLTALNNKKGNAKLNLTARFNNITANPAVYPLMESNADNCALKFYDLTANRYPYFNNNGMQTAYYMDGTFVNLLKDLKDKRLFVFAEKAPVSAAMADNDFNAYNGVNGSNALGENNSKVTAGEVSRIKARYYNNPVNEPSVAVGYSELQYNLAEAALKGYINGSAAAYAAKGIRANFDFYGLGSEADAYIISNSYNNLINLTQVLNQKYIANFMQNGWLSFYDHVRTGLPVLNTSDGGVGNNKRVPKRWMYPAGELNENQQHVNEAIKRQYPEGDNINGEMWMYKKE